MEANSDKAILVVLGSFIKEHRIRQNKTQQELADAAGINRSTLVQIEAGSGGGMLIFVQLLRALNQLEIFKQFQITEQISPLLLAKMQRSKRQRAGRTRKPTITPNNQINP